MIFKRTISQLFTIIMVGPANMDWCLELKSEHKKLKCQLGKT